MGGLITTLGGLGLEALKLDGQQSLARLQYQTAVAQNEAAVTAAAAQQQTLLILGGIVVVAIVLMRVAD